MVRVNAIMIKMVWSLVTKGTIWIDLILIYNQHGKIIWINLTLNYNALDKIIYFNS